MVWTPGEVPSIGLVLESARGGELDNMQRGDFTERWSWLAMTGAADVQDR